MRPILILATILTFAIAQPALAAEPQVGLVQNFGPDLSSRCNLPEGIAADPRGHIYASSLNFAATSGPANICVLDRAGAIIDIIPVMPVAGGVAKLLGMLFVPGEGLYVADLGGGRVVLVDPDTHAARTIATGFQAPNALAKDNAGNLYVSDSFPGTITKVAPDGTTTVSQYPQLVPAGNPPFGANGIAFDRNERFLYVANTSVDKIYRIAFDHGTLGAISLFATGTTGGALDGADGIAFDVKGNLYVCSNQSNEVAVLSPDGVVIDEIRGTGDNAFDGPASLVFRGRELFVSDLSLFDGGRHQKLSVVTVASPGAPLRP